MVIFAAVAAGMSAPYLLLSAKPAWMKLLPKPGLWMERVKQFMGFPLIGTLIWLLGVVSKQKGTDGIIWLSCFLLCLALAAWIYGTFCGPTSKPAQRSIALLLTKRELVKQQIQQALVAYINGTLKEKGLENALVVANVAITDFNFSAEFNRAIESKVQAEQQALQAKNEKLKRVTQAEALASEKTLAADADAYATDVQSKARAEAIRREAEALKQSPELIRLRTVEKWDGVLPRVNGGEAIPFLNLNSEIEDKPGR